MPKKLSKIPRRIGDSYCQENHLTYLARSCEFYRTSSSSGGGDCTLKLGESENVHHVSCLGVSPKTHEAKQACGGGIIPPEPSRKGCNFRFYWDFNCQENHLTYLAQDRSDGFLGNKNPNISDHACILFGSAFPFWLLLALSSTPESGTLLSGYLGISCVSSKYNLS